MHRQHQVPSGHNVFHESWQLPDHANRPASAQLKTAHFVALQCAHSCWLLRLHAAKASMSDSITYPWKSSRTPGTCRGLRWDAGTCDPAPCLCTSPGSADPAGTLPIIGCRRGRAGRRGMSGGSASACLPPPRRAPLATLKKTLQRPLSSLAAAAARWQARHEQRQRTPPASRRRAWCRWQTLEDSLCRRCHSLAAAAARWQARHERRQRVRLLAAAAPRAAAVGDQRQLHLAVAVALASRHLRNRSWAPKSGPLCRLPACIHARAEAY